METVSTNICLEKPFWIKCKKTAIDRGISLNQLVKNGLRLALNENDTVHVDGKGQASNDLHGVFRKKANR
jgi:hypothetical protein